MLSDNLKKTGAGALWGSAAVRACVPGASEVAAPLAGRLAFPW